MKPRKNIYLCMIVLSFLLPSIAQENYKEIPKQEQIRTNKGGVTLYSQNDSSLFLGGRIKLDSYYDVDSYQQGTAYGLEVTTIPLKNMGNLNANKKGNYNYTLTGCRINLDAHKIFFGKDFRGYIEMDFNGNPSATSNSYLTRIRHVYFEGDGWLIGQTLLTFADRDSLIYSLNNKAGVGRQATVRRTFELQPGLFLVIGADRPNTQVYQFAVSNASGALVSTNSGFSDNNSSFGAAKSQYPDGAMKLQYKFRDGYVSLRGLIRDLQVKTKAGANGALTTYKKNRIGWGVGFSGKLNVFGPLNILTQGNIGRGIGRYAYDLNSTKAIDSVFIYPTSISALGLVKNSFKLVKAWSLEGGLTASLTEKISSNIAYSFTKIYKPRGMGSLQAIDFHRKLQKFNANIIYDILINSKIGFELMHYRRKSGTPIVFQGKDTRFLMSFIQYL